MTDHTSTRQPEEKLGEGTQPLTDIRVLDLTQFLAGPYGTQVLGDLGAEVIKIETQDGDLTRVLPPHFVDDDSCYFHSVNRNKRSVTVDLKTQEGQELVRKLALQSDVLVENYRPGVLDRLGLNYADLSAQKPSLVWCSISGFGQSGPYRDRPAYDMIVQAMSGGMSLTGEPNGPPVRSGLPIGDIAAGLYGVIAILAALRKAEATGQGTSIDIAMLDCQIAMLSYQAAYYLNSDTVPGRQGRGHDSIPTYRAFRCSDDAEVVITANTERMWRSLCDAVGRSDLPEDAQFCNARLRHKNRKNLWGILEPLFLTKPSDAWEAVLLEHQVPVAIVNTLDRSLTNEQVLSRGMILQLNSQSGSELKVAGNPIHFQSDATPSHQFPPKLGGDEDMVLAEIAGLSPEAIATLRKKGVIGPSSSARGGSS